jgi:hypothetical protein
MISVNGAYLINIIERHVNKTLGCRRSRTEEKSDAKGSSNATNEEIADFILSIPYFDERLKNFMLGNLEDKNIIISQSWEIAFIVRAKKWSECDEWLHETFQLSTGLYAENSKARIDFLTLPY